MEEEEAKHNHLHVLSLRGRIRMETCMYEQTFKTWWRLKGKIWDVRHRGQAAREHDIAQRQSARGNRAPDQAEALRVTPWWQSVSSVLAPAGVCGALDSLQLMPGCPFVSFLVKPILIFLPASNSQMCLQRKQKVIKMSTLPWKRT